MARPRKAAPPAADQSPAGPAADPARSDPSATPDPAANPQWLVLTVDNRQWERVSGEKPALIADALRDLMRAHESSGFGLIATGAPHTRYTLRIDGSNDPALPQATLQ